MPERRGAGTLTIIKSIGNDRYEVVQNLATEDGARTMALDSKTGAVYLSTANSDPRLRRTAENPNPPRHPTAIAGSFKVLVARPSR
jgi:hypothetical protein